MPKGIVKCGNCKQWDLFKDGLNTNFKYMITNVKQVLSETDFVVGQYYVPHQAQKGMKIDYKYSETEQWQMYDHTYADGDGKWVRVYTYTTSEPAFDGSSWMSIILSDPQGVLGRRPSV